MESFSILTFIFSVHVTIGQQYSLLRYGRNSSLLANIMVYPCATQNVFTNHPLKITKLNVDPLSPTLPGPLTITTELELKEKLPPQVNMETNLRVLVPLLGFRDIPCYNGSDYFERPVGSCNYYDILRDCNPMAHKQIVKRYRSKLCAVGPGPMTLMMKRNLPKIPDKIKENWMFSLIKTISWEISIRLSDGTSNRELACGVAFITTSVLN